MVEPVAEPEALQHHRGPVTPGPARRPGVDQPVGDGVDRRHSGRQVELLEHESDPPGPDPGQPPVAQPGHVVALDDHPAGVGPVERAHQVQQRRLARSGRADDADQFARLDRHRHPAQGGDGAAVRAPDVDQLHQRGAHDAVPTTVPSVMPSPSISTRPAANIPVATGTMSRRAPAITSTP
jgi:hypothetical protein